MLPIANLNELIPDEFGWMSLLGLASGLALLLGGMETMGTGLRGLSGSRIRHALEHLGRQPIVGVGVGASVAGILHSAGATTAILISFVEAGIMRFSHTIPVVMGANIGTTFTGQLLAFKISWMVPVMLFGGLIARLMSSRSRNRALGGAVYGTGLLFLGLFLMSASLRPLREVPEVIEWLGQLESLPLGLLAGLLVTVLFQSSTATIGVMIGLASQGLLTTHAAIPLILGANIGSCSVGLIAGAQARSGGRRVAVLNLLFNLAGVLLFIFWIDGFAALVRAITPGAVEGTAASPREIANAHTFFNVTGTLLFLPLAGRFERITRMLVPVRDYGPPRLVLDRNLLRGPVSSPDLALAEAVQASKSLAKQVLTIVNDAVTPSGNTGAVSREAVENMAARVHSERKELSAYINEIGQMLLRKEDADLSVELALVVAELDTVGTLARDALALLDEQAVAGPFSHEGQEELDEFEGAMKKLFADAVDAYFKEDLEATRLVRRRKKELGFREAVLRRVHVLRMRAGIEASVRTDSLHLAWLQLMRQINTHSGRIARVLLDRERGIFGETATDLREGPEVGEK